MVRRLWRGETVAFPGAERRARRGAHAAAPGPAGAAGLADRGRQPRDLPRRPGEMGANVLTHLLGQTRRGGRREARSSTAQAWREAGHPGEGRVTLMLHTFVGDDDDEVRDDRARADEATTSRAPWTWSSSYAWSFPAFKRRAGRRREAPATLDLDEPRRRGDGRRCSSTPSSATTRPAGCSARPSAACAMVDRLQAARRRRDRLPDRLRRADRRRVLAHLEHLDRLRRARARAAARPRSRAGIGSRAARSRGTASRTCSARRRWRGMLLADDGRARGARARCSTCWSAARRFPAALARELRGARAAAACINMYGPDRDDDLVDDARRGGARRASDPDRPADREHAASTCSTPRGEPVPVGVAGRAATSAATASRAATSDRAELTAERFVPDPFAAAPARACTAPAISRAGAPTADSSSSAASTTR